MNLLHISCVLTVALGLAFESPVARARTPQPGPAAFLFEYRIPAGQADAFDEAYRRHLSWHRQAGDPLNWFGWYVATGERVGLFVDGTFGIPFASFDARVDPKGDAADFEATVGRLAIPASRLVYRLRPDLSTARTLEDAKPSGTVEVTHLHGRPGSADRIEEALRRIRKSMTGDSIAPAFTWYQLVAGGEQPGYLLMIPREGWRDYEQDPRSGLDLLLGRVTPDGRSEAASILRNDVVRQTSETWSYRADLSLLHGR